MWKSINGLRNLDRNDVLEVLGLQTRRTTADYILPTVGIFSVGLLVGAGLGLLLAPKSGRELVEDLRSKLQSGQESLPSSFGTTSVGEGRAPRGV